MKNRLLICIVFFSGSLFGQSYATLDINNILARINSNGILFCGDNYDCKFEVPRGRGKHTIFASNIWLGGMDEGGDLHLAAQTYNLKGVDFFYGPIADNYTSSSYITKYNKVWKMDKMIIEEHMQDYTSSGYQVPKTIADWPGNGDTTNGEASQLAPYIDFNKNSIYDPVNGDYPDIRGDRAIFYMINDDKQAHTETGGKKLRIEIHGMAYAFYDTANSMLGETVFVNFKVFNRSNNKYNSVYMGLWTDMDLGNYGDDFVGSDSLLGMFYTYNGDDIDEGILGYGFNPPAQGSVFLSHPISNFLYYNNDTSNTGNPVNSLDYYNYMKGRWMDGKDMTFGGNGYGGATPSNFMFSGKPETGSGWTEISSGNTPGDRRGIMSIGPFTFLPGTDFCIDVAFPYASTKSNSSIGSVALLRQRMKILKTFYEAQNYNCEFTAGIKENKIEQGFAKVYPNPCNGKFTVSSSSRNSQLHIYNAIGQEVFSARINSDRTEIDLSDHTRGMYFYRLICQPGIEILGKIVIDK